MADGRGVPHMQPDLTESAVVTGTPELFIDVLLRGPAQALPADRPKYANAMPAFPNLGDAEMAALVTYVRQEFGKGASPVGADQVAAVRAREKTAGR
jgi:mono/diheme cytochrome c family protein